MWLLDQLHPGSAAYNVATAVRMRGRLDTGALERAWATVVERHDVLRSSFVTSSGRPRRVIHGDVGARLQRVALRASAAAREKRIAEHVGALAREPFQLDSPPLVRAQLMT